MAKTKDKSLTKKEYKELLINTIHALECNSLRTGKDALSQDELVATLEQVRDSALFKLQSNLLRDETAGSSALHTIVDRTQLQIERLNVNKNGHADNKVTVGWKT